MAAPGGKNGFAGTFAAKSRGRTRISTSRFKSRYVEMKPRKAILSAGSGGLTYAQNILASVLGE